MFLRVCVTFCAPLALAGCAVGPDYHRPQVALPGKFIGSPVAKQPIGTDVGIADLTRWWDGFDDPLLSTFVSRALTQNLDLAQAVARAGQARAQLGSANAALLPSGTATAQAAAARQSNETPVGRIASTQPGYDRDGEQYEANLGASWEVDLFGGLRRRREAALADYQAALAGTYAARLIVETQTADTYVTIRGLQARLAVARDQVETQSRLLDTVRLQYTKGVAAELQVRQAEGALAQVEATLPDLQANLEQAMNALDVLLGDVPGTNRPLLEAVRPVPLAPMLGDAVTPAELLRRRPDVIVAERRLAASNARIGAALAEYYPRLTLSGLLGTATMGTSGLFTGNALQAQGAAGLRWRLFDFGRIDAEVAQARGANAEQLAAYRLAVLRAAQDVEDALSALAARQRQQTVLSRGEDSLVRARTASTAAYKGGVVSLIEVLDADARLLATRDALVRAQVGATQSAITSFRALGGGWDPAVSPFAPGNGTVPSMRDHFRGLP
ncbi:RND efflux system outer membrane lipoprotein NodT [Sphingomonas sp. LH128]|uniref:efflux transporter outer membrane subunit n=1 Tax=Sphingomonas sp. LH128 TaxID=473781 RepID=UPI00027CAEC6|nr:efflux transporter outer membrane subunit [Sphingomonas sp. LH128]EJU09919.1 RND efflux system outer membrane lipoprotein NodT [Sphingomonas sp. LH128]